VSELFVISWSTDLGKSQSASFGDLSAMFSCTPYNRESFVNPVFM
jgi:hypothetical protein